MGEDILGKFVRVLYSMEGIGTVDLAKTKAATDVHTSVDLPLVFKRDSGNIGLAAYRKDASPQ